eukprot:3841149-Amphidinium_carterae.1
MFGQTVLEELCAVPILLQLQEATKDGFQAGHSHGLQPSFDHLGPKRLHRTKCQKRCRVEMKQRRDCHHQPEHNSEQFMCSHV